MFCLRTHSTFYLQLYGVGHTIKDHSEETRYSHMGYSFRLAARDLLYAQNRTCHGLCYTSWGSLAGTRYISMSPPWGIDPITHRTMVGRSTTQIHIATFKRHEISQIAFIWPPIQDFMTLQPPVQVQIALFYWCLQFCVIFWNLPYISTKSAFPWIPLLEFAPFDMSGG